MDYLLLISRWLHLAAAIVAIGGAAFMRIALIPAAGEALSADAHQKLREALRARWAKTVFICIGVLLLTGSANFLMLALPPKIHPIPYHPIFGVKLLAALAIFFIASALVGRSPGTEKMRAERSKWLSRLLILAGIVVLLSGVLSQVRQADRPPIPRESARHSSPQGRTG